MSVPTCRVGDSFVILEVRIDTLIHLIFCGYTTLSREYREIVNKTQTVCYSLKSVLSPSKYAPSETVQHLR
jgi:hypothetical protein